MLSIFSRPISRSLAQLFALWQGFSASAVRPLACLLVGLAAAPALAQFGGGFGGLGPEVNREQLEDYADLLGMDQTQREIAQMLLEEYVAGAQTASDAMRDAMQRARDEFRETRDRSAFQAVGEVRERTQAELDRLEQQFLSDLESMLTPAQAERWPRVERAHLRATTLDNGLMSGERVDLFELVEGLELPEAAKAEVGEVMAAYELELDRVLRARNEAYERGAELFRERRFDEIQAFMDQARAASERVRDTHRSYARRIEAVIGPDNAGAFKADFQRASFPRVYRATRHERALEAAAELEGLTDDQREQLGAVASQFRRELSTINDRLAKAIEAAEESMTMRQAIAQMRGRGGGDDATRELFGERRDLGERALERLRGVLTEEQVRALEEAMPEAPDREGRARRGGGRGGPSNRL